ncbi:DNRLRE domain-containing protein [Jejuia spongiicola]|uniref:DNRLRE domain-containing protein n=1 Tax=Jejuia spongiicola TaxID=2942207 RepID=A0ABT0Q9W7_9FLAO|nr:DNRLRE domain-containing protein [Jejuia spongiicola]MCL6293418.1 DNRLRE domain-containing protein [Jejuia spongiicola]
MADLRAIGLKLLVFFFVSCVKKGNLEYTFDISNGGNDAVLSFPKTKNNYGDHIEINIFCDTINGIKYINRAILDFNLEELPKNVEVDSVVLQLFFNDNSGLYKIKKPGHSGNTKLIVENVLSNWSEDKINWSKYPKIGKKKLYFGAHKTFEQDFRFNISELVINKKKKLIKTNGFLLRLEQEKTGNYLHFCSKENKSIYCNSAKLKVYVKK